jgi:hypothetical protein
LQTGLHKEHKSAPFCLSGEHYGVFG